MVTHVGVIACHHEDGVIEPRLFAGFFEETVQGMIGIADALVDGHLFLFIYLFILSRHVEGMVTRQCEECCHEGLLHVAHLHAEILQERLVPDAPPVVGVGRTIGARIGLEVLLAIALLEARGSRETLET